MSTLSRRRLNRFSLLLLVLLGSVMMPGSGDDRTETSVFGHPAKPVNPPAQWTFAYAHSLDVQTVQVTLAYRFWDPKVDGDVPSKQVLLTASVSLDPAQDNVPVRVLLSADKSSITVGDKVVQAGKGWRLDPSFIRATEPKPNYDGFYILAQKPTDPKNPAAMGDVQNAAGWIELGISPQIGGN